MSAVSTAATALVAYHDGSGGGGEMSIAGLFIFLGAVATVVWLIFSQLRWLHTVLATVGAWAAGLGLIFIL